MYAEHRSHPLDDSSWLAGVLKFEISQFGISAFKVPGSRLYRFEKMARKALSKS
jgi:hypothetical protein